MPTYTRNTSVRRLTGAPYGDAIALPYRFATTAGGIPVATDATVALIAADIVRIGMLPAGTRLIDHIAVISDAFTALATYSLGFAYADGVDSADVPQDAAYFTAAATALSAVAVQRKTTTTAPVTLPKDAWLILTNAGATHSSVGILDVTVFGQAVGVN